MQKHFPPLLLTALLALSACSHKSEVATRGVPDAAMLKPGQAAAAGAAQQSAEARRYVAMRHQLEVELPAANLQAVFDNTLKKVQELGGEVLDASVSRASDYASPSGSMSLRLPPDKVDKFLEGVEQGGKVLRHQRTAEDKTDEVIDADARIANLTELRDRLRRMLADKPAQIKDVLEIEKQLAETQAQLDTINGVRKSLSKQTDMVAVQIELRAAATMSEQSAFAPVARAWNEAGEVIMSSAGGLITFVAAVLPWLVILVPLFWFIRKLWRGRKKRTP